MSACCDSDNARSPAPPPGDSEKKGLIVALAGNPNSGKTTIFNALTGLRQKVANYPGVTVEKKTGRCWIPFPAETPARTIPHAQRPGQWATVIDLPGAYSLVSRSPDEAVAMEVLRGLRADTAPPDVVVVVVDASNLQRNLYLVSQLIELGRPMVIALNMMDVAERRGRHVDPAALERKLGLPIVPVIGHKRVGIEALKLALLSARVAPMPDWPLPQAMKDEIALVGGGLSILADEPQADAGATAAAGRLVRCQATAERLLIGDHAGPIYEINSSPPVKSLVDGASARLAQLGIDPMQADIEAHYRWIDLVAAGATATLEELAAMGSAATEASLLPYETARARNLSDRVDAVLIHKVWGLIIFAAIMGSLFVTLFWAAAPIMDGIQAAVGWLGILITSHMADGPLKDLVSDGIFAGVGSVVVFVPQIALLFLFLAILEDSGYLARAAFLMDRLLSRVGLHGKSFIPLLSSFACAIPGIMATRTIENRKDRLATIFIAPFMSCSARLPVYTLLIGTLFASKGALSKAGIMLSLYALGVVAAAGTAWLFRRTLLKGGSAAFILEMPSYKAPQPRQIIRQVWSNTYAFLAKAGTVIFCLSVLLWALTYYPTLSPERRASIDQQVTLQYSAVHAGDAYKQSALDDEIAKVSCGEQLRHSIAGRLGHLVEPTLRPLGFDWKMGVGLVGAFAAREVFVSTMGIVYSVGDPGDETADLSTAMRADHYANGKPVWTPLVGVSLLVWFVLALQCTSTVAIVRRETGGWRWPIFMLLYMNGLAYVACLIVFQIGSHL